MQRVAEGVSMIAAAFASEPVIARLSDFKSNEYANLIGGERYEPREENPMRRATSSRTFVSASRWSARRFGSSERRGGSRTLR